MDLILLEHFSFFLILEHCSFPNLNAQIVLLFMQENYNACHFFVARIFCLFYDVDFCVFYLIRYQTHNGEHLI